MTKIIHLSNIYIWVIICVFFLYLYFKKKKINYQIFKIVALLWIVITFVNLFLNKLFLFFEFKKDPVFKYFLPPYSDYIFVSIKRDLVDIFTTIFISLIISLAFFLIAKRSQQKVLDYYDVGLIFLGGLIVGWSNIVVYLASIFILTTIGYLGLLIFRKIKSSERIKITPFIILAIIFTLVIGYKISAVLKLY